MISYSFRPRFWPTLGALVASLLFFELGSWQYGKSLRTESDAIERETRSGATPFPLPEIIAAPEGFAHAKVTATGHFVREFQFYLDNKQDNGVPGYQVITPFQLASSDRWLLVNRGWRPWPQGRRGQPEEAIPEGERVLVGNAEIPSTKGFFMMPNAGNTDGLLRMKIDLAEFEAWSKHSVQPIILEEISGPEDGLVRHWLVPEDRTLMHRGYAYQWWGMILATVLFYLYASLHSRSENS